MQTKKIPSAPQALPLAAAGILLLLGACGGGSDEAVVVPPPPPPAPAALTISGTAATGAAMAGAAVQIKCATGSASATATAEGSFSASLSGGALPCVLSATSSDGKTVLRSVAPAGTGTSATANVTPLSEIIVAQIAGGDAATLFTTFDAAAQAKLSATGVSTAVSTVATALKGTVDLTGVNPLSDALVAASPGKTGNDFDKKLDTLGAALKAGGTSVSEVAAAIVANPGAPAAVADSLLKPAATGCTALKSGKFHLLDAASDDEPVIPATLDAAKLTLTDSSGFVTSFKPVEGSPCAYTADEGTTTAFVAKSGVVLVRYQDTGMPARALLMVPDQAVPLAETAGTWNIATYVADTFGGIAKPEYSVQTLSSTSLATAGADCPGIAACQAWTPRPTDIFTVDPKGGYSMNDDEANVRLFPVKVASGEMAIFGMIMDKQNKPLGLAVFSKQKAAALPTVDQVDKFWDVQVSSRGVASAAVANETKVTSVDSAAGSFTRVRSSDGRTDSFAVNKPRDGMRYRAAGTSPTNDGKTVNLAAIVTTPLAGMGLTVYSSLSTDTANNFVGFSVIRP